MRLSPSQAKLINTIILEAGADLVEVARRLQVTPKTVRYHREILIRRGFVSEGYFLNLYALGHRYVNVYFSMTSCSKEIRSRLIAALVHHPRVAWMAELGGEFHYGVALLSEDLFDVHVELAQLPTELRNVIQQKSVIVHQQLSLFRLKVIGGAGATPAVLGYGGPPANVVVDEIDRKVIRLLGTEPSLTVRELAKRVELSPSAVADRVQSMRECGVIQGKWLRANFEALGVTSYKLLVYTHGLATEERERFRSFCERHRYIDHLIECVVDWDFEVGVVVTSFGQVMDTLSDCSTALGAAAKSVKVVPLLSVLKLEQAPIGFLDSPRTRGNKKPGSEPRPRAASLRSFVLTSVRRSILRRHRRRHGDDRRDHRRVRHHHRRRSRRHHRHGDHHAHRRRRSHRHEDRRRRNQLPSDGLH
jgi:DNA-binding Lrp family transcriptional regulator